ncbi:DegV family protein [Clostridium sp. P21]|uniref:DegV family protein n=1 Tax=Clostridium muellerianum TaxID=2716538 RepID=A0A7Y0EKR2_9CLOT|nr:DegV family protein [Clostridium muellerianum]NMM65284.1 DegV family protein [Clostridium muellerianum]
MEKIKIITDSTSDLPLNIIEKYGIEVLPLLLSFDEETYKDGVDINLHTLLMKMDGNKDFPRTAQVNPQRFMECYKKYLSQGYKIISIHISSKLSGTYQSACIAKDALETEDIIVIDSLNVTSGLGIIVMKAGSLKNEGLGIHAIEEKIKNLIPHVKSALAFATMDNLIKGGRISKTTGTIASILGIKPILAVENGEMIVKDKVRGSKKAIRAILDYLDKQGVKEGETSVLLHVENKDILDILREDLKDKNKEFIECEVGCVVGVYAGAGACGVFFVEDF